MSRKLLVQVSLQPQTEEGEIRWFKVTDGWNITDCVKGHVCEWIYQCMYGSVDVKIITIKHISEFKAFK